VDKNTIVKLISSFQNDGKFGHRKRAYVALVGPAFCTRRKREMFDKGRIGYIYIYIYKGCIFVCTQLLVMIKMMIMMTIIIILIMSPCFASTINLRFLLLSDNLLKCCGNCKLVLMSRKSKFCPQS